MGESNVNEPLFSVLNITFIALVQYVPEFATFPVPDDAGGINPYTTISEPN